jgi:hypothetical protein
MTGLEAGRPSGEEVVTLFVFSHLSLRLIDFFPI